MKENRGEALLVYDEIAALYEQLDHGSNGSQSDRKVMLSLYGGGAWGRSSQNSGRNTMPRTLFNYTGKKPFNTIHYYLLRNTVENTIFRQGLYS